MLLPKVSVVMPVYNRQNLIAMAIESVLMQTYENFELIIVDDGSTDGTVEVVKQYNDSRIRLIEHETNRGVAAARNTGYKHANGEYIVIADSDDINLPNKLEEQVNFLELNPDIDIVGCIHRPFKNGHFLPDWVLYDTDEFIKSYMIFGPATPASSMFRVKKIKSKGLLYHDEQYKAAVDFEWYCKMPKDVKFANILKPLYLYRWHDNQISTKDLSRQQNAAIRIRKKFLESLNVLTNGEEPLEHTWLAHFYEFDRDVIPSESSFEKVKIWAEKLIESNKENDIFEATSFEYIVSKRLLDFYNYYDKYALDIWPIWHEFKYKGFVDDFNIQFDSNKISTALKGKTISVFGTLRAGCELVITLKKLNMPVSYLIDNNKHNEIYSNYKIYNEEILLQNPVDIVILSNRGESRFLIKEKLRNKFNDVKVMLLDEIIK